MARKIGTRRGKSPIKVRLEKEREASRRDPEGKKSVVNKAAIASYFIPGGAAVKVGSKARNKAEKKAAHMRKRYEEARLKKYSSEIEKTKKGIKPEQLSPKESMKKTANQQIKKARAMYLKGKITKKQQDMIMSQLGPLTKMKKGGIVKSHRGDGIARSGRTKGRIV